MTDMSGAAVNAVMRYAIAGPSEGLEGCPSPLDAVLFAPKARVYLIVDAAKRTAVQGMFDLDVVENMVPTRCLFAGQLAEDAAEAAPYLLEVTAGAEGLHPIVRDFFADHWGKGTGIFLRTRARFDEVYATLRTLLRVRGAEDETANWQIFRFWDPLTARLYLEDVLERPDRAARFFRTRNGTAMEYVVEDGADTALRYAWAEGGVPRPVGPLVLDAQDRAVMQNVAWLGFGRELEDWLREADPERYKPFPEAQMRALSDHILAEGKAAGCANREDFAYLAHAMATLGGWCRHMNVSTPFTDILRKDGPAREADLKPCFVDSVAALPMGAAEENWADICKTFAALPEDEQVTPPHYQRFLARLSGAQRDAARGLVEQARASAVFAELDQRRQGQYLILTLCFGLWFEQDPTRNWSVLPPEDAIAFAWQCVLMNA